MYTILLLLSLFQMSYGNHTIDSLLHVYDREIPKANAYFSQREEKINSLRANLDLDPKDASTAYAIAELYAPYKCDSALKFAQLAVELAGEDVPEHYIQTMNHEQAMLAGKESHYVRHNEDNDVEGTHDYAMEAYMQAIEARNAGDSTRYLEWLLRSAISDLRCGVADNASSWMIAEMLHEKGDTRRAYTYINYSLSNAIIFNARLRFRQVAPLEDSIHDALQWQQNRQNRNLIILLSVVVLLLIIVVIAVVITFRQIRKMKRLNRMQRCLNEQLRQLNTDLQEANQVKEQYICRYLEVYSEYIQRLTKMARRAGAKDPDAFNAKEMNEFYRSFDNTFLSLYRDFVSDFNNLLQPEAAIWPKQGELLTTELRIYALIRLGIDSSSRIAELLCYSSSTIYNYRSRIRNLAVGDPATFEDRVRTLGTL